MTDAAACRREAKRLGCTLEVNRKSRHITIWLPEGKQVDGNPGTLDDVWPWIAEDLQTLDGDMEPLIKQP